MSEPTIRVAICGAAGRMGREVVKATAASPDLTLSAAIDHALAGKDSGAMAGAAENGILIETDLKAALIRARPDVMVDFTLPAGLMDNLRLALNLGVYPVVGTTGLSATDMQEIHDLATKMHIAAFVAPNFAIGAALMMQFAEMAAAYLPDVEIIELHHDRKVDSPSGTALLTAQRIDSARKAAGASTKPTPTGLIEKVPGARGACNDTSGNVTIHSVRLPGFVAHQEVIFGGQGQILTIRHDSIDRTSFMPGVIMAVRKVRSFSGLVVGLETLL